MILSESSFSARCRKGRRRMRKVHHPKIVQRAGRRWMVVCDDCARDQGGSESFEVDVPVESFEKAKILWEKHYDRRRGPSEFVPQMDPIGASPGHLGGPTGREWGRGPSGVRASSLRPHP